MTETIERTREALRGMDIAPLRGLRYDLGRIAGGTGVAVTSPPYDVISPEEHGRLLRASPHNITWLTLGDGESPGKPEAPRDASSYERRGELLRRWVAEGILTPDPEPSLYVYTIDYSVPGQAVSPGGGATPREGAVAGGRYDAGRRSRFLGLIALGRLREFEERIVLPHEQTFPKVVEDRFRLLVATRANLENILLLYSDPEGAIERLLAERSQGNPAMRVEAKPGEFHSIYPFSDVVAFIELTQLFLRQRPIIADGHHRYTTSLRFRREVKEAKPPVPGADWQMMTFANLFGEGLSILATHRLVRLREARGGRGGGKGRGTVEEALSILLGRLEPAEGEEAHFRVETREKSVGVRFPREILEARSGVAGTTYGLLHDLILGEWLSDLMGGEAAIRYYKEGTGEREALERGDGDLLFRMKPVDRREFETVVKGGEVYPHKTTYFYPKLWSGLVLWAMEQPERLALK